MGRRGNGSEELGIPGFIGHGILGIVPDVEAAPRRVANVCRRDDGLSAGVLLRVPASTISGTDRTHHDDPDRVPVRANKHAKEETSGTTELTSVDCRLAIWARVGN